MGCLQATPSLSRSSQRFSFCFCLSGIFVAVFDFTAVKNREKEGNDSVLNRTTYIMLMTVLAVAANFLIVKLKKSGDAMVILIIVCSLVLITAYPLINSFYLSIIINFSAAFICMYELYLLSCLLVID